MIAEVLAALVPVYEEAALEYRISCYLWMTWPDMLAKSMEDSLTFYRV